MGKINNIIDIEPATLIFSLKNVNKHFLSIYLAEFDRGTARGARILA